jgi:hypothetical protein
MSNLLETQFLNQDIRGYIEVLASAMQLRRKSIIFWWEWSNSCSKLSTKKIK